MQGARWRSALGIYERTASSSPRGQPPMTWSRRSAGPRASEKALAAFARGEAKAVPVHGSA